MKKILLIIFLSFVRINSVKSQEEYYFLISQNCRYELTFFTVDLNIEFYRCELIRKSYSDKLQFQFCDWYLDHLKEHEIEIVNKDDLTDLRIHWEYNFPDILIKNKMFPLKIYFLDRINDNKFIKYEVEITQYPEWFDASNYKYNTKI